MSMRHKIIFQPWENGHAYGVLLCNPEIERFFVKERPEFPFLCPL